MSNVERRTSNVEGQKSEVGSQRAGEGEARMSRGEGKRPVRLKAGLRAAERSVPKLAEDVPGEVLAELAVARHRLTDSGLGILIPVVIPAVTDEDAAGFLDLPDQGHAFHWIWSSATRRTPGIRPLVSSL